MANDSGGAKREYDIFFKQSVDGLSTGSQVQFSGVPVGQVRQIELWRDDPPSVRVRIAVDATVPILHGPTAALDGVGFPGLSQLAPDGPVPGAPPTTYHRPAGHPVSPTPLRAPRAHPNPPP